MQEGSKHWHRAEALLPSGSATLTSSTIINHGPVGRRCCSNIFSAECKKGTHIDLGDVWSMTREQQHEVERITHDRGLPALHQRQAAPPRC